MFTDRRNIAPEADPNPPLRCKLTWSGSGSHPLPRILVIDDQPDVRAMIAIVLRINHFEIVEAASAEAGLEEFERAQFDLAIVDIFLQGTNGADVIGLMRERIPGFPVVAISGMTALDFVSASPELSDVVCLQKPFRPNQLVSAVEAAYRRSARYIAESTDVA
jgi:DNA-binding response OmpR family regulator